MYPPLSQAMDAVTVELGPVSSYGPEDITCFSWIFILAWSIVPAGSVWPWFSVGRSYKILPSANVKLQVSSPI